jgi:hypothetical protein
MRRVERPSISSRAFTSSCTILPTGMPVQALTTPATIASSTSGRMSGTSPCIA